MGLKDALNTERTRKLKGPSCSVCALLESLPDGDDKDALLAALDDFGMSGEAISRALDEEGVRIQGQTIQRHRRKKCYGSV